MKSASRRMSGHGADMPGRQLRATTGLMQCSKALSLDNLVGEREQRGRHGKAERPRGLEIDYQLELGRLVYRQICRLLALEDLRGIDAGAPISICEAISVAH